MANDNESAFPIVPEWGLVASWGLSKRELFAAMAMQGFSVSMPSASFNDLARHSVEQADALLSALAQPKQGKEGVRRADA